MKNTAQYRDYEMFSLHVLACRHYLENGEDFTSICGSLGLCPQSVEDMLFEELGVGGDELLDLLRRGESERVLHLRH